MSHRSILNSSDITVFLFAFVILVPSSIGLSAALNLPQPFTPIKASAGAFSCLNRTTTFGPLLLPGQISAAGDALLNSPIRIVAEPASVLAPEGQPARPRVVAYSAQSARWEWSGESPDLYIISSMTADYDGFCWYEIRLEPKHPTILCRLAHQKKLGACCCRYQTPDDPAGRNAPLLRSRSIHCCR